MALSKRTKKRFLILVGIVTVLVVGAGVAYITREKQLDQRAMASLDTGLTAYEKGEYKDALHAIGSYLQRFRSEADAKTLYAYADSRLNVPVPNDRHLTQGIALLEQTLQLEPDHTEAIDSLLTLRVRVGQTLEAITLAEKVLKNDPTHQLAHETRIFAHKVSGNIEASIKAAQAYFDQHPDNIDTARQLVGLMLQSPTRRLQLPGEQGVLTKILSGNEQKANYQLLLAQAYRALEDQENATARLDAAIALPADDDDAAKSIASEIMRDQTRDSGGFEAAFKYIAKVIEKRDNDSADQLRLWLAQRRYYMGQSEMAAEVAQSIPADSTAYAEAQALLALLAWDAQEQQALEQHAQAIRSVSTPQAKAWDSVLSATILSEAPRASEVRPVLMQAIEAHPDSAYMKYALAIAYRDLGEYELAIRQMQPIVFTEPAWWAASLELSNLYQSVDAIGSAYRIVDQTYRLHRDVDAVRLRWAILSAMLLQPNDPATAQRVLTQIDGFFDEVVAKQPEAEGALLFARARCLSVGGQTIKLRQAVKKLAALKLPEFDRVCREIDRRFELGLDLGDEQASAAPLELAKTQAAIQMNRGQDAEAIKTIEAALNESSLDEGQRERAMLSFLEHHSHPDALPFWRRLLDASPDSPVVLRSAAQSNLVLSDEELGPHVIELLKKLTGEEGFAWQFAQLKHEALTAETDGSKAAVADRLGTVIREGYTKPEARLLLARVLIEMDNQRGALNQLSLAVDENPYHAASNLALVRIALLEQRYPVAKAALARLAMIESLSPVATAQVARIADMLGESDVARSLRSRPGVAPFLAPTEHLTQLRTALVDNQDAEVKRISAKLLHPTTPADALHQMAMLMAVYRGEDAAQPALEALAKHNDASPSLIARTNASIQEILGKTQASLNTLEQAVAQGLAKQDRELWSHYLRLLFAQPDGLTKATQVMGQYQASQDDKLVLACFEMAQEHRDQRRALIKALALEALAAQTPQAFLEAAQAIHKDAWQSSPRHSFDSSRPGPSAGLLAKIDDLRQEHDQVVGLYNLLTTLYLMDGQQDKAIAMAQRTRERFTKDPVSARLLAQAFAGTGQWRLLLGAATTWRQLAAPLPENLQTIDLLSATALIETDDPLAALELIKDNNSPQGLTVKARAMIRADRLKDAEKILLVPARFRTPQGRANVIQLAITDVLAVNPSAAGRWLDQAKAAIPNTSIGEQLFWAQASFIVGQQSNHQARQDQAFEQVSAMTGQPQFPSSGWLLIAIYHEAKGDLGEAEKAYRKALSVSSAQHQAANNLANLLLKRGDFDEARKLAEQAVAFTQPTPEAVYLDTLAQILLAKDDTDSAMKLWAQAIRIDPKTPTWYIMQAELMHKLLRNDEARDLLRRMRQWADPIDKRDKQWTDRLKTLEKKLGR